MASENLAAALLDQVQSQVTSQLGTQLMPNSDDKIEDVIRRVAFCEDMVKRCEVAEKKADDNTMVLRSLILKIRLYGNLQKAGVSRETQEKLLQCYEKALKLVKEPAEEAELRYGYALASREALLGLGKEKVTENLEKALHLAGPRSELGIKCANELGIPVPAVEKAADTEPKKGGCFIATACYGSYEAPEVVVLRQFRDEVLLRSAIGKAVVACYYAVSPPLADFIAGRDGLKRVVRDLFVAPAVRHAHRRVK